MVEYAMVVSVDKDKTRVQITDRDGCSLSSCGSCKGCSAASATVIEAVNKVGAKIGQHVKIERSSSAYVKSIGLLFGFPMVMLIIGVVLGYDLTDKLALNMSKDALGVLLGIVFWFASYLIIRFIDKKFKLSSKAEYLILEVI
jgi:sigma-E factor negative regulatory protein RseC